VRKGAKTLAIVLQRRDGFVKMTAKVFE